MEFFIVACGLGLAIFGAQLLVKGELRSFSSSLVLACFVCDRDVVRSRAIA